MDQLPIFVNLKGRKVILVGEGDAADAKRRLIERAGGTCVDAGNNEARIAFIAVEDEAEALAAADDLKARGLLVNVVDRPEHCDFTTPAIVDRAPVLIAVGTGGASAGMAKAIRQRIETMLPNSLGQLANSVAAAREAIRRRWPDPADSGARSTPHLPAAARLIHLAITNRKRLANGWTRPREPNGRGLSKFRYCPAIPTT